MSVNFPIDYNKKQPPWQIDDKVLPVDTNRWEDSHQKLTDATNQLYTEMHTLAPQLFSVHNFDYKLDNPSYVRFDTFSWQSGAVYKSAYNKLLMDYEDVGNEETDTYNFPDNTVLTIRYKRTNKGRKICLPSQEEKLLQLYNELGVAWYYIVDEENTRFKLPRSKWYFKGANSDLEVGNFIEAGLPNITGRFFVNKRDVQVADGAFSLSNEVSLTTVYSSNGTGGAYQGAKFNASLSNPLYGNSTTVQPPTTHMFQYMYIGNTVQNQTLIDIGQVEEQLNNKLDLNALNMNTQGKKFISGLGKPSEIYEDLTLLPSGSTYIAPSNGYFTMNSKVSGTASTWVQMINITAGGICNATDGGASGASDPKTFIMVNKGDSVQIIHSNATNYNYFRFIYDKGEI